MKPFPETDWKKLRSLKEPLLQLACEKILYKLKQIIDNPQNNNHQTYLNLWKVLTKENEELSLMFDDLKRSTAVSKLAVWKKYGLISDNDFNQFTEETIKRINIINSF